MHAFGPLSAAAFRLFGGEADATCFEDELDLGSPRAVETSQFVQALERALERARVPFAFSSDDVARHSLKNAAWTLVVCPGALDARLLDRIDRARARGVQVTFGPHAPRFDATFRALERAPDRLRAGSVPALVPFDEAAIGQTVLRAKKALDLPTVGVEPDTAFATLHVDRRGRPRVLFVINPTDREVVARVDAGGTARATDLIDGLTVRASVGTFQIGLGARTTRMLELEAKA
jgi:beta-galactosidase